MFRSTFVVASAVFCCAAAAHAGIVVSLVGDGVDPNRLTPGQNFDILVSLAAEEGQTLDHVRTMQFDHVFTSGSSVDKFTWEIHGINNDSRYFKEVWEQPHPTVARANYILLEPEPGFILNLTDEPTQVGRYNLTFSEPGFLNLLGPANPPNVDSSIYFLTGFGQDTQTFSQREGNVIGGILALTPEPATLTFIALGGLVLLRRRRR